MICKSNKNIGCANIRNGKTCVSLTLSANTEQHKETCRMCMLFETLNSVLVRLPFRPNLPSFPAVPPLDSVQTPSLRARPTLQTAATFVSNALRKSGKEKRLCLHGGNTDAFK